METSSHAPAPNEVAPASIRAIKDIAFGSIAGMVSKVFEHPFDLTKVRLQSQVLDSTARFNGPIDCLMQTWTKEGIRGLYRVHCTSYLLRLTTVSAESRSLRTCVRDYQLQ